jgi:hypothetical protein
VASVGLTIKLAVLLALREGSFLWSSFFVSFSAMEKERRKKLKFLIDKKFAYGWCFHRPIQLQRLVKRHNRR